MGWKGDTDVTDPGGTDTRWLLIVLRVPTTSFAFIVGEDQLDLSCPRSSLSQWKQTVKGGSALAEWGPALWLVFPGAFIKILLSNGLFSACEQGAAEPSLLLSDLRWPSFSMSWSLIMELTVMFILSGERGSCFHFFFNACLSLNRAQCLRLVCGWGSDGAETKTKLICISICKSSCQQADSVSHHRWTNISQGYCFCRCRIFLIGFIFYFDHWSKTWLTISPNRKWQGQHLSFPVQG